MSNDNRVVVIGSGPPGATAALFLARAGLDVLVLEAGLEREASGLTVRVRGVTLAKTKSPLRERGDVRRTGDPSAQLFEEIAPGGLSNHWSCAVPRFSVQDFEDAERAGEHQVWPVGYADLEPWYAQVEPLLHIAGEAQDCVQLPAGKTRYPRRLKEDWAPVSEHLAPHARSLVAMPYSYGDDTTLTRSGTPFNSYTRLLAPEVAKGKIKIRFGARVSKLEWSPNERKVTRISFKDRQTGSEDSIACRAVVVAAGALNTPEVLLASTSADFPKGLGNEHDVLGRYLHDHPLGKLVVEVNRPFAIHPAAYVTRTELSRAREPLYAAACMQWCSTTDLAKSALGRHPGRLRSIGFSVFGTMVPTPDDYVALDRERRGPDGIPGLELHIRHPQRAVETLEEARDHLMDALSKAGLSPRVAVWKVEPPGNSNHYAGSCRMHASPRYGMLDSWGRMHAVRNVAVADSSVFTTNPEKNPVLTSMTLAARAAGRLADELRAGDL